MVNLRINPTHTDVHDSRNDADAKQEELRLMVGYVLAYSFNPQIITILRKCRERYRDLLQASTSIISIHRSSENVLNAVDETKEIIASQEIPYSPLPNSPVNKKG